MSRVRPSRRICRRWRRPGAPRPRSVRRGTACLAFARPFCVALKLTSEVEQRLDTLLTEIDAGQIDGEHQVTEKTALNGMLEQATASNQQSQKALVACDEKMKVLRAKYAR